ncbi:MAG: carbohydrate kinase [Actinobacteria bacterium]|nr:carbohydrate kinase [Actinomycetota bacterium]
MSARKSKVWVAGEALIDLLPRDGASVAVVGGGAANTAKALANLEIDVSWVGGVSSDEYGNLIKKELESVDLSLANYSSLPTALAKVSLDRSGSASYEFLLDGTATFDFDLNWLPNGKPEILHIGTLATIVEPGASRLFDWAKGLKTKVVFDPNVRPSVLSEKARYRVAFEKWARISSIVKMSNEDLEWLGYSTVNQILELGPELLVVTHGAEGMTGYTASGSVSVPGVNVQVVDTVGAGDTVGAVIVEGLLENGITSLVGEKLFEVLSRAAKAAAITCSRVGANPPKRAELE